MDILNDITGQFPFKGNATSGIHYAQRTRSQRHIQSGKILRRLSPLFTDILRSYRELDLRSGSAQLRMLRAVYADRTVSRLDFDCRGDCLRLIEPDAKNWEIAAHLGIAVSSAATNLSCS
jgi:hypothetical protein